MNQVLHWICIPLGFLMKWCWRIAGSYGLAILLFTLISKLILLPVSVWIQKNSILMVKIQPDVNFLKARHYGDKEAIAEGQAKLFREYKYHPMLSLVPLIIQIVLLMGVVEIIYHPLSYLFAVSDSTVQSLANYLNIDVASAGSSVQLQIVDAIKSGTISDSTVIPAVGRDVVSQLVVALEGFKMQFCGFSLSAVPMAELGRYILVPVAAGLSSLILCLTQNLANVIQHEQSKFSKYGLTALSVGISLYLGCFVPTGIALYWIASNLFSVAQMYLLNVAINPKKYVDYDALERSRRELADIEALELPKNKDGDYRKKRRRERKDYKKFFRVVNKHIVFYSEKSGFYKYFQGLIDELLARSNLTVHYITNDPDDVIFDVAANQPRIRPYYIGLKKLIPLMMLLECDIMVMTTPDFDKFYLKRSRIKPDIEYIYVPHDMMSVHMGFREGALDKFDTVFCTGEHVEREIRATEKVYSLPPKRLVRFGYPFADSLVDSVRRTRAEKTSLGRPQILIAPSWQEDNLMDSCLDVLLPQLCNGNYHVIVRPHPEYVKRYFVRLRSLVEKYEGRFNGEPVFELDFSSNGSLMTSDLLITDWSGIAPEFCFATGCPALFVNTKMKCLNPNWEKIGIIPQEIAVREELGRAVAPQELDRAAAIVGEMFAEADNYRTKIDGCFERLIFNHGTAAAEGAKDILRALLDKQKTRD